MKIKFNVNKQTRKYYRGIGILSGTSIDGIDIALVRIFNNQNNLKISVDDFRTYKIPADIHYSIIKNSNQKTAKIDEICKLNVLIGKLFADAINKFFKRNNLSKIDIDFVGSHGQTIHHLPRINKFLGHNIKSTFQIGDPSIIANLTGVTTVGDFRIADCSFGGDGAPLVPFLDYILFTHKKLNRVLLNIGGISNVTVLPVNCKKNEVMAFDTGPGNILLDLMSQRYFNLPFDKDSQISVKGKINSDLLKYLCNDPYLSLKPPKSTGREYYGEAFLKKIEVKFKKLSREDIMRTITEYTAYTIFFSYKKYIEKHIIADELIISGGGAKNPLLFSRIKSYFPKVKVRKLKHNGLTVDNKEAVLFAVLSYECLMNRSANMPSVTGSSKNVILGKICPVLDIQ